MVRQGIFKPVSRLRLSGDRDETHGLFAHIRWRLTLIYTGALAGALILSGVVLYLAVQQSLLSPIQQGLKAESLILSDAWQQDSQLALNLQGGCPVRPRESVPGVLVACFASNGKLLSQNDYATQPELQQFVSGKFVASAVGTGQSEGTVQTSESGDFSSIERYATTVTFPGGLKGVLLVGSPVGTQISTLNTLLHLLLLLGLLTLLLSAGGGLFLANRALQPARLAYSRQRDFIADASHELRTPLTMLRSSIELVLRGRALPAEDAALLEDTVQETIHLTSLANNMLSLARLDADGGRIEEDVVDLAEVALEVYRWAQPLSTERGVALEIETQSEALVIGDRSLLLQAFLILVDNAIKYNRAGGVVQIRTDVKEDLAIVEVRDTGIGISQDHLARLGERFYRVDKARSRESGGAGLGLAIVRSIARRHDALFELDSEEGVGTIALLSLPAVERRREDSGSHDVVSSANF